MKRARCIVSLILAIIMLLSLVCVASASNDYDVIFGSFAEELWKDGLLLGSNGSFNLDKPLTRAEGAVMVVRLLGKEEEAKSEAYAHPFTDVPVWASSYVGYCYHKGILKGISDTKYGSGSAMTSAQYSTLMLRVLGYKDNVDFTFDMAATKAREIGLLHMDDLTFELYFSPTGTFLRDQVVLLSFGTLNASMHDDTGRTLKDTISMPGKPAGDMPTYVAGVPNDTGTSGGSSGTTGGGTNKITVEHGYAANGVCTEATYFMDGKQVAWFSDGGYGTIYNGDGWYLVISRSGYKNSLFYPKTLTIRSEDKTYTDFNSQGWKKDPYIVKNNIEPVISFILEEMYQNNTRLQG